VTDFDSDDIDDRHAEASFNACAEALGEPQPQRQDCLWRGVWDAYNEQCTIDSEVGNTCGDLLADRGYDVDAGVGVFFELRVTGPMATYQVTTDQQDAQERNRVLGLDDPTAPNCVVGTRIGFDEKLPGLADGLSALPRADSMDALAEQLCSDADGDTALLRDGFNDGGSTGGSFSAAVNFAKLLPTPEATQDSFGDGDELCMHGVWSVQPNTVASDTADSIELEGDGDGTTHHFSWCVPLASG
jgi:hypothetical protein